MKHHNLFVASLTIIFICHNSQVKANHNKIVLYSNAVSIETQQEKPIDFLKRVLFWYKNNYSKLNSLEIIAKDNKNNFCVDFNKASQYLENLNSENFFDENFILNIKKIITDCDKSFKENPQSEGPLVCLNYDLILLTQDSESVFHKIDNPKIISEEISDNRTSLKIDIAMRLEFKLIYKNGWHIYEINNIY